MANHSGNHSTEVDDIDEYVAAFTEEEREVLGQAEAAIDIAIFLSRAREHRGLSQTAAAQLAGLQQQAVSRFERTGANPQWETIRTYLDALGFGLELSAIDRDRRQETVTVALLPTGEGPRKTIDQLKVLVPSASGEVNQGYSYMEASEVANRQHTINQHADAVALWGRALTLYREGVLGESDYSEAAGDSIRLGALQAQSQLLGLGVNSAKAALDLLLDGYYSPTYATVRHMIESFAQCVWLNLRPGEAVRWFDSSNEESIPHDPPRMRELIDQIKSDLIRWGLPKDRMTDMLDHVYRSWKLMSKGSHPSGEGLVQTLGAEDGKFLIGGTYQRDMCLVAFDHGLFAVVNLLPQALEWNKQQSPEWMAEWERLRNDVSTWRTSNAAEVSTAEEKLDEAA